MKRYRGLATSVLLAIAIGASLAGGGVARGATFYLGPNGRDSNAGTGPGLAVLSFARAMALLRPGDELVVLRGTYSADESGPFVVSAAGSAAGYITISGERASRPLIAPERGEGAIVKGAYVTLTGFEIAVGAGRDSDGIVILPGAHHVHIIDNLIHDNGGAGIEALRSDYITISNNLITGNGRRSIFETAGIVLYQGADADRNTGFHNVIQANVVAGNGLTDPRYATLRRAGGSGQGIAIDDLAGDEVYNGSTARPFSGATLIQNNIVFGNAGAGISIRRSRSVAVVNNTVWHDQQRVVAGAAVPGSGARFEIGAVGSGDCQLIDNIAIAGVTGVEPLYDDAPGDTVDDNLLDADAGTRAGEIGVGDKGSAGRSAEQGAHNVIGRDPLFAAPSLEARTYAGAVAAFALRPGSPALGRGTGFVATPFDIRNNIRPLSGVDLGAEQFGQ